jgi:hypothetical protein
MGVLVYERTGKGHSLAARVVVGRSSACGLQLSRAEDVEAPSDGERGWVHLDDLAGMAGMEPPSINVYVSRARQQLAEAGLQGAAGVVARRPGTGLLRFGGPS